MVDGNPFLVLTEQVGKFPELRLGQYPTVEDASMAAENLLGNGYDRAYVIRLVRMAMIRPPEPPPPKILWKEIYWLGD